MDLKGQSKTIDNTESTTEKKQAAKVEKITDKKAADKVKAIETKADSVKKIAQAKTEEVKKAAEEKKEEAAKVIETVKEEVVKAAKVPVKKAEEKKTAVKTAAKKTVKKTASKAKKPVQTTMIVEYQGRQIEEKDIIAAVKKVWTQSGNKIGEIKTMELYVKPEDSAVYFVINGSETGKAYI